RALRRDAHLANLAAERGDEGLAALEEVDGEARLAGVAAPRRSGATGDVVEICAVDFVHWELSGWELRARDLFAARLPMQRNAKCSNVHARSHARATTLV